jgi:hypothetical protein
MHSIPAHSTSLSLSYHRGVAGRVDGVGNMELQFVLHGQGGGVNQVS